MLSQMFSFSSIDNYILDFKIILPASTKKLSFLPCWRLSHPLASSCCCACNEKITLHHIQEPLILPENGKISIISQNLCNVTLFCYLNHILLTLKDVQRWWHQRGFWQWGTCRLGVVGQSRPRTRGAIVYYIPSW